MRTKEIRKLRPDYFTLHYAGRLVGHASTEAEATEKLNTITDYVEFCGQSISQAPFPSVELELVMRSILTELDYSSCGTVTYLGDEFDGGPSGIRKPPYIYRHQGELWICTHASNSARGVEIDPPQRVKSLTRIVDANIIAVVTELEIWMLTAWCVERQLGKADSALRITVRS